MSVDPQLPQPSYASDASRWDYGLSAGREPATAPEPYPWTVRQRRAGFVGAIAAATALTVTTLLPHPAVAHDVFSAEDGQPVLTPTGESEAEPDADTAEASIAGSMATTGDAATFDSDADEESTTDEAAEQATGDDTAGQAGSIAGSSATTDADADPNAASETDAGSEAESDTEAGSEAESESPATEAASADDATEASLAAAEASTTTTEADATAADDTGATETTETPTTDTPTSDTSTTETPTTETPTTETAAASTTEVTGATATTDTTEAAAADPGDDDPAQVDVPEIIFPVVGPSSYTDTWLACRGAGCSRRHKGADIFSLRLTPVVAAADGVITATRRSSVGISGNMVIIETDDGWRFLYIHLNNDSPGTDDGSNPQGWIVANRLRTGDRVKAGQVIGYLGDSGNAEGTPAHVHFEVHHPEQGAIDPGPFIDAARDAGRTVPVSSLASTEAGRAEYAPAVDAWYRALLKREPSRMELFAWTDRMEIGFATVDDLIADLTMAPERRNPAGAVVRSFEVSLDRRPTINELRAWEDEYRNGSGLADITAVLIASSQFEQKFGTLSDEQFVKQIYRNAIGRDPSAERLQDWLTVLADGQPRSVLTEFWADSYTIKNDTWHDLEVLQAFRASLDRLPNDAEFDRWVAHLDRGGLIPDVVTEIRASTP